MLKLAELCFSSLLSPIQEDVKCVFGQRLSVAVLPFVPHPLPYSSCAQEPNRRFSQNTSQTQNYLHFTGGIGSSKNKAFFLTLLCPHTHTLHTIIQAVPCSFPPLCNTRNHVCMFVNEISQDRPCLDLTMVSVC